MKKKRENKDYRVISDYKDKNNKIVSESDKVGRGRSKKILFFIGFIVIVLLIGGLF